MAETIRGINVVIGAETTGLTQALSEVTRRSRDIQSELKQVERLLRLDPGNTELLAQKQRLLSDAIANTSTKLDTLRAAQQQVDEQFARGEINEGQYRAFQREIVRTEQELQEFEARLGSSEDDLEDFGDQAERTGERLKSVGEGMKNTGEKMATTFGSAALAIGTSLGVAVKSAADFDTSMRKAGAIAGATTEEFEAMKAAALDLGATTSLSASEVAEAMTEMAAKGFTANQTIAAMPGVIAAAEASGESLSLAADTVSSALNIWSLKAEESARVADVLAMSANVSAAGIDDLGYVLKYAGGPAAALGISLEEVAAAAGILTNAGLDGSNAGTALRASLLALNNPAKAQQKMMDNLGISMRDSAGNVLSLAEMVGTLRDSTEHMTEADKVATLAKLVGTEAVSGFLSLMSAGPAEIEKMTASLENSGGASTEAAAKMKAGIGGALENLSGAIDSFVITVGDQLIPIVQKVAGLITELVNKFTALPESVQQFLVIGTAIIGVLSAIAAIIGIVIMVVGSILTAIGSVTTALAAAGGTAAIFGTILAALTSPITIIIASIVALVAGLTYLYNTNETVKNALNAAWEFLKAAAESIFNYLKSFWATWGGDIISFFAKLWDGVKGVFGIAMKVLNDIITKIFQGIIAFWDKWGDTIVGIFKDSFEILKIVFKTVFDVISSVTKKVFENLKTFWDTWGKTITGVFNTVLSIVKTIFEGVWNTIKIVIETVIGVISGIIKTFLAIFKGDWAGAWENAKETVSAIWNGITGIFGNAFSTMAEVGKNIIKGLISGIKNMKDAVVNTAKNVASSIGDSFKNFFGIHSPSRLMLGYGTNIVQGLANGISNTARQAIKSASSLSSAVAGAMSFDVGGVSSAISALNGSSAPSVAGVTNSNTSVNFADMFRGANFNVRSDDDLTVLGQLLGGQITDALRGAGV